MHGGSAHNGSSAYNGNTQYNGASNGGATTDVGGLNNLHELWVGWNDPKAGM